MLWYLTQSRPALKRPLTRSCAAGPPFRLGLAGKVLIFSVEVLRVPPSFNPAQPVAGARAQNLAEAEEHSSASLPTCP